MIVCTPSVQPGQERSGALLGSRADDFTKACRVAASSGAPPKQVARIIRVIAAHYARLANTKGGA